MNKSVVRDFNSAAEKYDIQRRELIPLMDVLYGIAVELVTMNSEK